MVINIVINVNIIHVIGIYKQNNRLIMKKEENFEHFLLTNFNLRKPDYIMKDKNGNNTLTSGWMKKRIYLFEHFSLPSVLNQINKNFIWLISIDKTTDYIFIRYLHSILDPINIIKIHIGIFDGQKHYLNTISDLLLKLSENKDYIITTRFDNDDLIHKNFINEIQKKFNYQDFMAINYLKIYMIDPYNYSKIYMDYRFSNHFISLIEKRKNKILTVFLKEDRLWNEKGKIIQITNNCYCCEIIHDNNLVNNFSGFPVMKKTNLIAFGLSGFYKNKLDLKFWKMSWFKLLKYLLKL